MLVRKCLDDVLCSNFRSYYEVIVHLVNTRNNGRLLRVPCVKLAFARKAFYCAGATLYNGLPAEIRKEKNFRKYKLLLKQHFL